VIGVDPRLRDPAHGEFQPTLAAAQRYGCRTFVASVAGAMHGASTVAQAPSTPRSTPLSQHVGVLQVAGSITSDETWDADLVRVVGDVFVEDGVVLTIAPGTRVEFEDYYRLQVRGTLDARGRPDRQIVFTTDEPAAFALDASRTGCWNGIRFDGTLARNEPSRLAYCVLEYSKAVGGAGPHPRCGGALSVEGYAGVELENCILRDNLADWGGALFLYRQANARIAGSLIARNHALQNAAAIYCAYSYPTIVDDTIVANQIHNAANPFVETSATVFFVAKPLFAHCIVWGNVPDFVYQHQQTWGAKLFVTHANDIQDWTDGGDNFALDPRFVDAANADWRLSFASPCIDAAQRLDGAGRPPATDLAGSARELDGDLDTDPRVDLGAYEHSPLELASSGALGSLATARCWGEDGGSATLYAARGALVPRELATPFGGLRLSPRKSFVVGNAALGSSQPGTLVFALPSDPALAGETFGFQLLASSSLAPAGQAYTNAVELTLVAP
jgi:hypothetical protein